VTNSVPPPLDIQKMVNDVLALLRDIDPVSEGVKLAEQGRRTVEALIVALENFGATMDNLNQAASRVNRLLDDVEEPIRRIAGMADQAGSIMTFLPSLAGKAVANLAPKPSAPAQPGTSETKNPDPPAR
jgi:ABC-type transporter Mla subunit MlaD